MRKVIKKQTLRGKSTDCFLPFFFSSPRKAQNSQVSAPVRMSVSPRASAGESSTGRIIAEREKSARTEEVESSLLKQR